MEESDAGERGQLRLLSYNIHKGLSSGNRSVISSAMKTAIHSLEPDFAFFQEVVGQNTIFQTRFENWPEISHHEYFKSDGLAHSSYGKNAEYAAGNHGNAILSRHPFCFETNVDISIYKFSRRGFLYTKVEVPGAGTTLHTFCTHFGLIEQERIQQTNSLCKYIEENVPANEPLIVAGDFNDWRQRLSLVFEQKISLKEVFMQFYGSHARSFPSWLPISCLDRIYYRNLILKSCKILSGVPWSKLSDHLPLIADFNYL
jgi:endonuclease/exonuclease/phosphatase family metal-dependent hydrolase